MRAMREKYDDASSALDRYLCAVLALRERFYCVRAVDVAHYLGCSKASVSVSARQLAEDGLLSIDQDGALSLTPAGEARAARHAERCRFFAGLFVRAGLDAERAEREAFALCRALSEKACEALRGALDKE